MVEKLKVVWVCSFSNEKVRQHFSLKVNQLLHYILRKSGNPVDFSLDTARWNTNAIEEFEKFDDIELHIISPIRYLNKKEVRFEINRIKYYFFREENSGLFQQLYYQFFTKYRSAFQKNRNKIKELITEIDPKVVHVIGAENPYYSLSILDLSSKHKSIIQLQALLDRLVLITKNEKEQKSFAYKGNLERSIFKKADYIGTTVEDFKKYIKDEINPDAKFLDISIAMGNKINLENYLKKFDFVYFSINLDKAGDDALMSFAIAHKMRPEITLNMVGGYDSRFKEKLDKIIEENHLENSVFFEGKLPTHSDVITQIQKSKFALLPLKMDFVPSTIREAISNGLPVVTTITENGTTKLNEKRQSVLLSEQGDYAKMAKNMIMLLDSPSLAEELRLNAAATEEERNNNYDEMRKWVKAYKDISNVN